VLGRPDDHDRAPGIVNAVLAHRSEQRTGEGRVTVAVTVAANDEHVGIAGLGYQQVLRRVRRQHESSRRSPVGADHLYENLRQLLAGLLLGLDSDRVDRPPRVDRDKGGAQELGLTCRPADCGLARLRTVNPDDDT
jgi:hypothetical protein